MPFFTTPKNQELHDLPIYLPFYDARNSGVVADGTTDCAAAISSALQACVSLGYGICQLPAGTIKCNSVITWPTTSDLTMRGWNMGKTVLEFSSSTTGGIVYSAATRIFRCFITDMTIHGGGAGSGNGLDLADWDRGGFERLRVYAWNNCFKLSSTATRGALHNLFINNVITNGTVNGLWLTGAQGCNQTHILGGEISISGTGLNQDQAAADQLHVYGTSFESNTLAVNQAGVRSRFLDVRFEGNTNDIAFGAASGYNILSGPFFNPAKYSDLSATKSNRVLPHGFAASATERPPLKFIPCDPTTVTLAEIKPGSGNVISHLFEVYEAFKVSTVSYVPWTQSGNVDIAICDTAGVPIATTGSTVVGTAGNKQDINFATPFYIGPGRQYYVALVFDNGTAGFSGFTCTSQGFNLGQVEVLQRTKAIAFPIASQNCVAGASGTTSVLFARLG